MTADEYKTYLFPLLFLKRISDVYDEEFKAAMEESDDDEGYSYGPDQHRFQIPPGCHWSDIRETTVDVGAKISGSMKKIESSNVHTLYGIFTDFDEASWTNKDKLPDENLKNLVEHLSMIRLDNESISADVMGQAYEYLIKKFADETKESAGEFYTPRAVVSLMIRYLDPKAGETVYDPACGTGGMLIESMNHIVDKNRTLGKLFGQESNLTTASIARMNLFLHGADDFNIARGDTLRNPMFLVNGRLQTFDCVVANPPFSLKRWGADKWASDPYGRNVYGTPSDNSGDFAWLQHMVCSMDPDHGRMGVILPQGVLFKKEFKDMRRKMLESNKLEAVVQLAGNLFYGTQLAPCILFLRNNKENERIRFVDASGIFKKGRAQNFLLDEHVESIIEALVSDRDIDGISKTVSLNDLDQDSVEINVSKYVVKEFVDDTPPYEEVIRSLMDNIERSKGLEARIKSMIEEGGFLDE
ncbi:MAG: SAM-dependent DNA methyltransferase [Candidatus Methanomethylophilaceae archaeon]|nr:SAM-dependent DNA methyltransferase [Candidatus Methanomethylophilaceae archaeon]